MHFNASKITSNLRASRQQLPKIAKYLQSTRRPAANEHAFSQLLVALLNFSALCYAASYNIFIYVYINIYKIF